MKLAAIFISSLACGQNMDEVIKCYECQHSISELGIETGNYNCVEPDSHTKVVEKMKFREHHNTITGKVGLIRTDCQFLTGHGYEEEIQPDGSSKYIAFNYTERGYYDNFEGSQTYVYDQHASGMVHKQQYHLCGSDNDECVQTATYPLQNLTMPHSSVKSAKTVQESEPHASDCFICNSHVHYDDKENTWVMKQEDKNCIEHPKRLPPKFHLKDCFGECIVDQEEYWDYNSGTPLSRITKRHCSNGTDTEDDKQTETERNHFHRQQTISSYICQSNHCNGPEYVPSNNPGSAQTAGLAALFFLLNFLA